MCFFYRSPASCSAAHLAASFSPRALKSATAVRSSSLGIAFDRGGREMGQRGGGSSMEASFRRLPAPRLTVSSRGCEARWAARAGMHCPPPPWLLLLLVDGRELGGEGMAARHDDDEGMLRLRFGEGWWCA